MNSNCLLDRFYWRGKRARRNELGRQRRRKRVKRRQGRRIKGKVMYPARGIAQPTQFM